MMRAFVLSLGCSKNEVDSERIAFALERAGFELCRSPEGCDLVVINTCAFVEEAVKEAIESILEVEEMKERGEVGSFWVVGCLVSRYGRRALEEELPLCDGFFGADPWEEVARRLGVEPIPGRRPLPGRSVWTRYLKVSEGCSNRCSYCTIPSIRGPMRSRSLEEVRDEFLSLLEEGAKEVCLVAQDLASWGVDLYGEPALSRLLFELDGLCPSWARIRLLYLHPARLDEALLESILSLPSVQRYLDVPIQHASRRILEAMGRRVSRERMLGLFRLLREADPDFALRTTVMVGFPGETEEDFEDLLEFLEEVRFDRLGAFAFSPEEGTPASSMEGQVPEEEKEVRLLRVMSLQEGISRERNERFVGRRLSVLLEGREGGFLVGRSFREAPEVDGLVLVRRKRGLKLGEWVSVRVEEALEHDLVGSAEGSP